MPPLARATEWAYVTLDLGDGPKRYRRELNVMPQWAGSCWYELRYLDPTNEKTFCDPGVEQYWMGKDPSRPNDPGGVDLYVGGVEHAVLHLLYSRFWHKALYDLGHVTSEEPFRRLFNQGYIQAFAYTDERGVYVPADEVVEVRPRVFEFEGKPVTQEYGKMGKSLNNVVTPDDMSERYGADTFRMYEMGMGPMDMSRPWQTRAVVGLVALPAAAVAAGGLRKHRRDHRCRHRAGRGDPEAVAPHHRRGVHRLRRDGLQHRDRQADRADQPPDQVGSAGARGRWPRPWC